MSWLILFWVFLQHSARNPLEGFSHRTLAREVLPGSKTPNSTFVFGRPTSQSLYTNKRGGEILYFVLLPVSMIKIFSISVSTSSGQVDEWAFVIPISFHQAHPV
jgi:hypothetical protein